MGKHDSIWALSKGDCRPSARQTIRGGVYDSLIVPETIGGVKLYNPIILVDVVIKSGSVEGTIIVPDGTVSIKLGGSLVNVRYWSWSRIEDYLRQDHA